MSKTLEQYKQEIDKHWAVIISLSNAAGALFVAQLQREIEVEVEKDG